METNTTLIAARDKALTKLSKDELLNIYFRSHRVVDRKEVRRMNKPVLIGDILRSEFGRKICDAYFA